ncbi:MAG: hypothetical protein ACQEXO_02045 [Pseudomonadota bacterium]
MARGLISAGNARLFANALQRRDIPAARLQLGQAAAYAQQASSDRVVLACEWLTSVLAEPINLQHCLELLEEMGAASISMLLVLRDPLEQCLSLYKHRAKRGTVGDIDAWVALGGYGLPANLASLRDQIDARGVELVVRRYDHQPGWLDRIFFEEWLGISTPQVTLPGGVNPSLSLTELVLVRQMAETRPALVGPLFDALAAVPSKEKVQGAALEAYARAVAARAVAAHADEWAAWNERLPEGEKLIIPEAPTELPPRTPELGLSERQLQAFSQLLADAATPRFLTRLLWRSRLRPSLGRIKRRIWR